MFRLLDVIGPPENIVGLWLTNEFVLLIAKRMECQEQVGYLFLLVFYIYYNY